MSQKLKADLATRYGDSGPPEILVPDPQVWAEFGITSMSGDRWTKDPDLDFPPAIKVRGRNFRSRRLLEEFKANLLRKALAGRKTLTAA
jgi:hypothetical protein